MLALEWREWMTRRVTSDYLANRAFYQVQAGALVDNPDQRIASDVRCAPPVNHCYIRQIKITLIRLSDPYYHVACSVRN